MKPLIFVMLTCFLLIQAHALTAAEADSGNAASVNGTVAEIVDVGNYVYLRLEEPDTWIATSPFKVTVGDRVSFSNGAEMRNFYSKTLDRTFESILFVQTVTLVGQDMEKLHEGVKAGNKNIPAHIPKPVAVPAPAPGEIPPLDGGKTIVDIFSDSADLDGQTISVRAKVIKFSENILGKNWITLQDGTGTEPENKLIATSSELVSPGDLVIASGTVKTDIDIGAGYKYKVLLEEATFSQNSEP